MEKETESAMKIFGENLKKIRLNKGYKSQKELAKAFQCSAAAIANYEAGTRSPDLENLIRLADLLEVSLDELVRGSARDDTVEVLKRIVNKDLIIKYMVPNLPEGFYFEEDLYITNDKNIVFAKREPGPDGISKRSDSFYVLRDDIEDAKKELRKDIDSLCSSRLKSVMDTSRILQNGQKNYQMNEDVGWNFCEAMAEMLGVDFASYRDEVIRYYSRIYRDCDYLHWLGFCLCYYYLTGIFDIELQSYRIIRMGIVSIHEDEDGNMYYERTPESVQYAKENLEARQPVAKRNKAIERYFVNTYCSIIDYERFVKNCPEDRQVSILQALGDSLGRLTPEIYAEIGEEILAFVKRDALERYAEIIEMSRWEAAGDTFLASRQNKIWQQEGEEGCWDDFIERAARYRNYEEDDDDEDADNDGDDNEDTANEGVDDDIKKS